MLVRNCPFLCLIVVQPSKLHSGGKVSSVVTIRECWTKDDGACIRPKLVHKNRAPAHHLTLISGTCSYSLLPIDLCVCPSVPSALLG